MNRPRLDQIEGYVSFKAHESDANFFDVVAAGLAALGVHVGLLISLAAHAQHLGVAQQIQNLTDVIDTHVIERAAGAVTLLDKRGRSVSIYEGSPTTPPARRAREIYIAQFTAIDQF